MDDHDSFMGMGLLLADIWVPKLRYNDYMYIMTNEMNLPNSSQTSQVANCLAATAQSPKTHVSKIL